MSGTRAALLVGCSNYEDLKFQQLSTSVQDVDALTRVLTNRTIGDFTVDTLLNEQSGVVSEQIERRNGRARRHREGNQRRYEDW